MAVHHVHELEQAPVVVDHLGQDLALVAQDLRSGQGGCLRTRNAKKKRKRGGRGQSQARAVVFAHGTQKKRKRCGRGPRQVASLSVTDEDTRT